MSGGTTGRKVRLAPTGRTLLAVPPVTRRNAPRGGRGAAEHLIAALSVQPRAGHAEGMEMIVSRGRRGVRSGAGCVVSAMPRRSTR